MIIGGLVLTVFFFFQFMAGKAQGIKECEQAVRDMEMEDLRAEVERLKRQRN